MSQSMTGAKPRVPERTSLPNGDTVSLRELFARVEGLRELLDERNEHYQELREADSEAVDKAFKNSQMAIDKADAARAIHDAAVNEWRQQYNAQEMKFQPKAEYDNKMKDLNLVLERLSGDMQAFPSKTEVTGQFVVQTASLKAVSDRVQTLETARSEDLGRKAEAQGSKTESNATIGLVIAALGMMGGLSVAVAGLLLSR